MNVTWNKSNIIILICFYNLYVIHQSDTSLIMNKHTRTHIHTCSTHILWYSSPFGPSATVSIFEHRWWTACPVHPGEICDAVNHYSTRSIQQMNVWENCSFFSFEWIEGFSLWCWQQRETPCLCLFSSSLSVVTSLFYPSSFFPSSFHAALLYLYHRPAHWILLWVSVKFEWFPRTSGTCCEWQYN